IMYGFSVLRATTYGNPVRTLIACASGTALTSGVTRHSVPVGNSLTSSSAAASVSSVSPSKFSRATETAPTLTTLSSRSWFPTRTEWVLMPYLPARHQVPAATRLAYRTSGSPYGNERGLRHTSVASGTRSGPCYDCRRGGHPSAPDVIERV